MKHVSSNFVQILYSITFQRILPTIFQYYAFKSAKAKNKVQLLCEHIHITIVNESAVFKTLQTPAISDFEDGLEYYSAVESKCDCIITEDVDDFYFSKIEVLRSEEFFRKYLFSKK